MKILIMLISLMTYAMCAAESNLETVDFVDLKKYTGTWYEIEKIPNSFQRNCTATRATYTLKRNGKIRVLNECITNKGKLNKAKGTATVENHETNAELLVSFFFLQRWFSSANYYILDLGPDYSYVLVGSPSRKLLWILARTTTLDENIINNLKAKAQTLGFDTNKMTKTSTWPESQLD